MWVIFLRAGAVLPFIAILGESGPLVEVRWDVKQRFEGLFKRVTPCHVGAAQRPGVRHPSGQEFALARNASHGHARNVAGPSKNAVAVVVVFPTKLLLAPPHTPIHPVLWFSL